MIFFQRQTSTPKTFTNWEEDHNGMYLYILQFKNNGNNVQLDNKWQHSIANIKMNHQGVSNYVYLTCISKK